MARDHLDPNWNPQDLPLELNPAWQRKQPPALELARRGVRYGHLTDEAAARLVLRTSPRFSGCWPAHALAAVGPNLFLGRDGEGRFIPWDVDATDENRGLKVRERPWPWCWGDIIWAVGVWNYQPVYLRLELDGLSTMTIGTPADRTEAPLDIRVSYYHVIRPSTLPAEAWLELRARPEAGVHVGVVGPEFWALNPPPPRNMVRDGRPLTDR